MKRKKRAEAPVPRETVERAARVYPSNKEAAAALGIAAGSFGRPCRRHSIETPQQRRRRAHEERMKLEIEKVKRKRNL